jgi:cyanophycin synthetase
MVGTLEESPSSFDRQYKLYGVDIAGDKQLTRKILSEAAIPVPQGKLCSTEEDIIEIFREFRQSVVVKPCQGNQGKGVSLNLQNESDVLAAFRLAEMYDSISD